jgi:hypothetical protein
MENFLGNPVMYGIITALIVLSGIVFVQLGEISLMTKVLRSDDIESAEIKMKLKSYRKLVSWFIAGIICALLVYSIEPK